MREIHALRGEESIGIPDLLHERATISLPGLPARIQLDPSVSCVPQTVGNERQGRIRDLVLARRAHVVEIVPTHDRGVEPMPVILAGKRP